MEAPIDLGHSKEMTMSGPFVSRYRRQMPRYTGVHGPLLAKTSSSVSILAIRLISLWSRAV